MKSTLTVTAFLLGMIGVATAAQAHSSTTDQRFRDRNDVRQDDRYHDQYEDGYVVDDDRVDYRDRWRGRYRDSWPGRRSGTILERRASAVIRTLDRNRDGALSLREAAPLTHLRWADGNRDRRVTRAEVASYLRVKQGSGTWEMWNNQLPTLERRAIRW